MSWRDRPYAGGEEQGPGGGMHFALPPWTPVVKRLVIANVLIALLTIVFSHTRTALPGWLSLGTGNLAYDLGGLDVRLAVARGQIWRFFTTQYLHGSPFHLLFNMIGLYFLGPPLERRFGARTFFVFYTTCGVVAGVLFVIGAALLGRANPGFEPFLIGASGSVLGLLAGCAILFPQMVIILLFFPVPIRVAALLFLAVYVLTILWSFDLSNAAHLGGMIGAWAWIMLGRRFEARTLRGGGNGGGSSGRIRRSAGNWRKKQEELALEQEEVDRILAKVHAQGIASLTRREKKALARATERQRERDREKQRQLSEWNVR